jgi:hypothetical protein
MMKPQVVFYVPKSQVRDLREEVIEWGIEGMHPDRTQTIGTFALQVDDEMMNIRVEEVPVACADYMSASLFVEMDLARKIAKAAQDAGLNPQIFHESYEDLWNKGK